MLQKTPVAPESFSFDIIKATDTWLQVSDEIRVTFQSQARELNPRFYSNEGCKQRTNSAVSKKMWKHGQLRSFKIRPLPHSLKDKSSKIIIMVYMWCSLAQAAAILTDQHSRTKQLMFGSWCMSHENNGPRLASSFVSSETDFTHHAWKLDRLFYCIFFKSLHLSTLIHMQDICNKAAERNVIQKTVPIIIIIKCNFNSYLTF